MALADLLLSLEREAAARADARLAEARAEAERLIAAHAAGLDARRLAALDGRAQAHRADGERSVVAARREAERNRLLARHELLARVRGRARDHLARDAGTERGRAAVAALVAQARTYLSAAAGDSHSVAQPTGARLTAADGSVEVDATLESVLERLWPELAMDTVRRAESPA